MSRWKLVTATTASIIGLATLSGGAPAFSSAPVLVGQSDEGLGISATPIKNLYPGAVRRISVSFSNPNRFPIAVYAVRGELTSTSKRGCHAVRTNLEIRDYRGALPLTIPARGRRSGGYLEAHMPNSVAPACQSAFFTISLTGKAMKAGR
jgi:hypothetical protein